jgi:hypothetical protein
MTTRSDGQVSVEGSLCSRVVRPFTDGSDGQKLPTGGDARVSALSQKPGMALRYGFKGMGSDAKATDASRASPHRTGQRPPFQIRLLVTSPYGLSGRQR